MRVCGLFYIPEHSFFSAINATTIEVTFSDGVTEQFTVEALQVGNNTRTIQYDGKSFQVTVTIQDVAKAAVTDIKFHNYRHISVEFNAIVDEASATDPANYYFEIVEGDAAYGAAPTLLDSNQLSKIQTEFGDWWDEGLNHITAKVVDGKTVVDIRLPEDARFTNVLDDKNTTDGDNDDERTLHINLANGKQKALIKNTIVNVAVRNVKDINEVRNIDTYVQPIHILDEERPELVAQYKDVAGKEPTKFNLKDGVELTSDGSDKVLLAFNEPVFDAHDLEVDGVKRDVIVYVNGKKAASTLDTDLDTVLEFAIGEDATYENSLYATLDVEAAVEAALGAGKYKADGLYNIKVVGVTDLAGNIQTPSTIEFTVTVKDPGTKDPDKPQKPVVKSITQVADNIFRVEFNDRDATGEFIIENSDGEGGTIKQNIPLSVYNAKDQTWYSYVSVEAIDVEDLAAQETADDILAYDGQDYINRVIKVNNPFFVDTVNSKLLAKGDNKNFGNTLIKKDIYAPVVVDPDEISEANRASAKITLKVKDVVPKGVEQDYPHPVMALKYKHDGSDFDYNNVDAAGDYLPIKVSYVDKNGATHAELITNKVLPNNPVQGNISYSGDELALNESIGTFWYGYYIKKEPKGVVPLATLKSRIGKCYYTFIIS